MGNNNEVIGDLRGLINILNDGKEGYASASELLQHQRTAMREALSEIETCHHRIENLNN